MHVKVFRAYTMREAIEAIKTELGPEAVILSTKDTRPSGPLTRWFGRPLVEVTAAVERTDPPKSLPAPSTDALEPRFLQGLQPDPAVMPRSRFNETLQRVTGDVSASTLTPSVKPAPPQAPSAAARTPQSKPPLTRVKSELRSLHQQIVEAYPEDTIVTPKTVPLSMTMLYRDMVARGLAVKSAVSFVQEIHERLAEGERLDHDKLRSELRRLMKREIAEAIPLLTADDARKTALFFGPSGVGKTTAIAKLAAHYVTEQRRSVGLITLDTYRMAAVEHVKSYAEALEIPFEAALTVEEVAASLRRWADLDLVLIDTGGRNLSDAGFLNDVRRLTRLDQFVETYLVLSATTREDNLLALARRCEDCPVNRLLFTKLDEATGIGSLLTLHRHTGVPLSYFSTGARVPHDLEPAGTDRLADLLLDGRFQEPAVAADQRGRVVSESLEFEQDNVSA